MPVKISAIVTGHREGRVSVPTLRSYRMAVNATRQRGHIVEPMLILDRPDDLTEALFRRFAPKDAQIHVLDHGDQGLSRNEAVARSNGELIAFLDGDDLWQQSWLNRAIAYLERMDDENCVAHPEFNYFYEGQSTIFRQIDQESPEFRIDLLRLRNFWDALCVAPRGVHINFPYAHRDLARGWALEDWQWNLDTVAARIRHKVVPDTVIFKRRRQKSQHMAAVTASAMPRPNGLSRYDAQIYALRDLPGDQR